MEPDENLSQKIAAYQPSLSALDSIREVPLLFTVGITAAGKDTVMHRLIKEHPDDYRFTVSHTTRKPRSNNGIAEKDGAPYYFIDKATANRMLDDGALVEANYYAFNFYGTSIVEIERAGQDHKILVSDIDVNGIDNFVRLGLKVKPVFLLPPSYAVWRQRLQKRYTGPVDVHDLHKRLQTALTELEKALSRDYFYLVINDDLEATVQLVNQIAHGETIEPRHPKAIEIARQIATEIAAELQVSITPDVNR